MVKTVAERASSITRAPTRIIEAALEEFTEHGIDGARVDQIVRRAGVSKQLFYYYFESKEEVYKLVLEDAAEHAISLLLEQDYQDMSAESAIRSEEHTSELQSLMRISYAVFCVKKKKQEPSQNLNNYTNNQ